VSQGKQVELLGPVDTAFFYVDSQQTPMNLGALTIFDGRIDFEAFKRLIDSRIHRAPLYQKRVVQPPLNIGQPAWMPDPNFCIDRHLSRVRLSEPGNDEQLRITAGRLVSGMLARDKPLWEIYFIEGLETERTAILFKIHHCMVDGLSAVELFTLLLDIAPGSAQSDERPDYDAPKIPGGSRLIIDSLRRDLPHKARILNKLGHDLNFLGSVLSDKEKRRKTFVGIANLINDNIRPIKKLRINGTNSGRMTLAWADFSLQEVHAIRSGLHASVNDVMLSVLGGALETYMRDYGDSFSQPFLRVLIPVNVRASDEKGQFGNRISVLPVDVPFNVSNPLDRLATVTEYTTIMKQSSLSKGIDLVLTLPALAPALSQPLIWSIAPSTFAFLAHTWCTNVAGPQLPVYLMNHQMLHTYGYFPLNPSMGMACVVFSYNGRVTMTLIADAGIVPDVNDLAKHLEQSYALLRKAATVDPIDPLMPPPAPQTELNPPFQVMVEVAVVEAASPTLSQVETHVAPAEAAETTPSLEVNADVHETAAIDDPEAKPIYTNPPHLKPRLVSVSSSSNGVNGNGKTKLFSAEWALACQDAINRSSAYRSASHAWDAGAVAFILKAAPEYGYPNATAVSLDLYRGECRAARNVTYRQAISESTFALEGDYHTWDKLLRGEASPVAMLMNGNLRLRKGSITRLAPFAESAQELLKSAQLLYINGAGIDRAQI
jgi:WS/DGAT/MGAT family acyltransferase